MLPLIPLFPIFPGCVGEGGVEAGPLAVFFLMMVMAVFRVFLAGPGIGVVGVGCPAFAVCIVGFAFHGVGEDLVGGDDEAVAFDTDVARKSRGIG